MRGRSRRCELEVLGGSGRRRDEAPEITRADRARAGSVGEKRGSFGVELEGEIAAMVELARGPERNKAAPGGTAVRGPFRRSVKVVAGARNHRELTLMV